MIRLAPLAVLAALTACAEPLTRADFEAAYTTVTCEQHVACFNDDILAIAGYSTVAECETFYAEVGTVYDDDCAFDAEAAQICIDDFQALTCTEVGAGEAPPESCETACPGPSPDTAG